MMLRYCFLWGYAVYSYARPFLGDESQKVLCKSQKVLKNAYFCEIKFEI